MKTNGLWLEKDGRKICYNPWTHFEVNNPNGNVTMCCDRNIILGNVNEKSILEIWNDKPYQEMRNKMYELGGEIFCSPDCLLLRGTKDYQAFSWFDEADVNSQVYINAIINENEIHNGREILESKPRWMRFAYSYQCNYDCYHCYQKNDRKIQNHLPDSFITQVSSLSNWYQYLFLFGGEPTLFKNYRDMLDIGKTNPYIKNCLVTNGSLLKQFWDIMPKVNWALIDVSMDAASEDVYASLRNKKNWAIVNKNLEYLKMMREEKYFIFTMGMTVNTRNCHQLEEFVEFALSYNAQPILYMVCNPAGEDFEKQYLDFSIDKLERMLSQLGKLKEKYNGIYRKSGLQLLNKQVTRMINNKFPG